MFKKELIEFVKSVVMAVIMAAVIIMFIFKTVSVEGLSMYPTLHNGDKLIVEKVSYYFRKPKPQDIVIIKYPADPSEKFVKRVVAVSGDKVKIEDNKLFINGEPKDEPYIFENTMQDFEEVKVPPNCIFVLGDNRNESLDSRDPRVGFVNLNLVEGRAALRIYPFNNAGRIR